MPPRRPGPPCSAGPARSPVAPVGVVCGALLALVPAGCTRNGDGASPETRFEKGRAMLEVSSSAFAAGERIPKKYTGEGQDISPPLEWSGTPEGTQSFAIVCDDPDAPTAKPFVHWVAYGIPSDRHRLTEGSNGGAREGKNDFGKTTYGGPMPPPGHGVHNYHFKVYALDGPLDLSAGATKDQLLSAMKGHILAEGELTGTYER